MDPAALNGDDMLATTRSVRRKLDLSRPVPRELIEECLALAQQAPTGSNLQHWHFVVVTDAEKRAALADLYRRGWEVATRESSGDDDQPVTSHPDGRRTTGTVLTSALYLRDHLHEVPVHLIPCIERRTDDEPVVVQAGYWASILPAAWSFMLAARARGLGTCYTNTHLFFEREAADLLGIPYEQVMQAGLISVGCADPAVFKPAARGPLEEITHWDTW